MPERAERFSGYSLALLGALSLAAGMVDCVCYIALFHVFVANMTGNTIAAGIGIGQGRWPLLFRRGLAIPLFVLGLLSSRFWMKWAERRELAHAGSYAYLAEALLLATFIFLGRGHLSPTGEAKDTGTAFFYLLVSLPSFAMGLQNATLSHFGDVPLRTTHVTGTLAHFADELVTLCYWYGDQKVSGPGRLRGLHRQPAFHKSIAHLGAWALYLGGATLGACLKTEWQLDTLWLAVLILVAVSAAAARLPSGRAPSLQPLRHGTKSDPSQA